MSCRALGIGKTGSPQLAEDGFDLDVVHMTGLVISVDGGITLWERWDLHEKGICLRRDGLSWILHGQRAAGSRLRGRENGPAANAS